MGIGIKNLQQILGAAYQVLVDSGTTTDGSNTTLEDSGKSWVANEFVHDRVEFTIATTLYRRIVTSNTGTELTFAALPAGVTVPADINYEIWRYVGVSDLADRAARLLGVIYGSQAQQLLQRAATFDLLIQLRHAGAEIDPRAIRALTSSDVVDISDKWARQLGLVDISRVLGALLAHANPVIVRLTDGTAFITSPSSSQLPAALTAGGNLKLSHEEAAIAVPSDIQARYPLKTTRDIAAPAINTDYYLPETGNIDLSNFIHSTFFIRATTNKPDAIYVEGSLDGTNFYKLEGYEIPVADFVLGTLNTIDVPLMLADVRLLVSTGDPAPDTINMGCIRKA